MPFVARGRDTGHRLTSNAWRELKQYYREHGYPEYGDREFYGFFYAELLPLVGEANRVWEAGDILKTSYDFRVLKKAEEWRLLWYVPNEVGGITVMKPEDY